MSSKFLNATGAAAIAAMLVLSAQTASAQITFPWEALADSSKAIRRARGSPTTPIWRCGSSGWKASSGN